MKRICLKTVLTLTSTLMMTWVATGAQAVPIVEINIGSTWVTGAVSGLETPWPFAMFRLDGSFAAPGTANITLDGGVATLTVDPLNPPASSDIRRYTFTFDAKTSAVDVQIWSPVPGSAFAPPLLETFDSNGSLLQSVHAAGQFVSTPSNVPEPATGSLLLAGLVALPWLARRGWAKSTNRYGARNGGASWPRFSVLCR